MAHLPSSKKRLRQTKKRTPINRRWKERIKKVIKGGDLLKVQKVLDKAAKKGIIHKRKAARLKSRLATIRALKAEKGTKVK